MDTQIFTIGGNNLPEGKTQYRLYLTETTTLDRLERESNHCYGQKHKGLKMGECLKEFIDSSLGCEMTANSSNLNQCKDKESLKNYMNLTSQLHDTSDKFITTETGCKIRCLTESYKLSMNAKIDVDTFYMPQISNDSLILHFVTNSAKVNIIKDVLLYDFNNLVADVGGLFGLLLGISIFGIIEMGLKFVSKYL